MRTVSIVSSKGGVGKTTLATLLAVRAARDSKRVAVLDLDPQQSLAGWLRRRPQPQGLTLIDGANTASDATQSLDGDAWDWLFIDTPPAMVDVIEDAIAVADLAVIPLRPSALDLIGSETAVALARELGAAYLCVVNDAELRWKSTRSARDYLLAHAVPVAETTIAHRAAYLSAVATGRTAPEIRDGDAAADEVEALWAEIKAAVTKARRSKGARS